MAAPIGLSTQRQTWRKWSLFYLLLTLSADTALFFLNRKKKKKKKKKKKTAM